MEVFAEEVGQVRPARRLPETRALVERLPVCGIKLSKCQTRDLAFSLVRLRPWNARRFRIALKGAEACLQKLGRINLKKVNRSGLELKMAN